MRWLRAAFLALGVGTLVWLVYHLGPAAIWRDLRQIRWGLAIGCALHLVSLVLDSVTLRSLIAGDERPRFTLIVRASVCGHAINEGTPGGKVGEITKFAVLSEAMPRSRAAAALVAQNLVMIVVNCGLVAVAPTVVVLLIRGPSRVAVGFAAVGFGFLVLGALLLLLLQRGVGRWPFRLLVKLRVAPQRVARWEKKFGALETTWTHAARDRRSMLMAWGSAVASRLCNVVEGAIYFRLAGGAHAIAGGFLGLAGAQAISWVFFFVPFQAGSAESGVYTLFNAAGLSGPAAVVGELARKLRVMVFITLGVAVLALTGWRKDRRPPTS